MTEIKSQYKKDLTIQTNETTDEAMPLITFDTTTKKFFINPEIENIIRKVEGPIGVISVAGMYRTGKSYLLNRMLLNRSSGFSVGPSINPCTKGLWVWSKPINGYSQDGTPLNVLVIDTEGIGATDEDQNHDSKIFTLGILLSSFFIFNSLNSIDENAIQNLSFIVNITKNIQLSSRKEENDPKDYSAYLPSFLWVIRDFSLQLKNQDGEPITAREYLERSLEVQKGFTDSIEQKNKIRNLLKDFFKERDCVTLVRPLTSEENLQNLERLDLSKLRPEFSEQILNIRKKVLHKIKPKSLNGQILNGEMFCNMMHSYVDAINNGAVPVIENAWSFMCKNECYKSMKNAIDAYEKIMSENFLKQIPIYESELQKLHKEAKEKAVEIYNRQAIGNFVGEFLKNFKDDIKEKIISYKTTNEKEAERLCNIFIQKNFCEIEKNLKQNKYKTYQDFKFDLEKFINYYTDCAPRGPGREGYLNNYLLKNIFDYSEFFIKKYLNEIDIISNNNNLNLNKINSEVLEIKNEMTNEITKKNELIKKYENEKNELIQTEKDTKENLAGVKKDKEIITRDLNEKLENLKKDYEKKINDLKNNLANNEDILKETERRLINSEAEFEKQKLLLEQKIKFSEKNIEDLNNREKEYTSEIKNIKKDKDLFSKESKEKYEAQIKALTKKFEENQEKNIDLETKLLDKEKRAVFEKIKQDEIVSELQKKIEDFHKILNCSEDELKISEKKHIDSLNRIKEENIIKISEITLIKDELEGKLKESEEKFLNLKSKTNKEISMLKQNLELSESSYKEYKCQAEEEKQSFNSMITLLENKNLSAINSQEEYIKQINEIKNNFYNEIKKIEGDSEKTRTRLNTEIEEIKNKNIELLNTLSSERENFEKILQDNSENLSKLSEQKNSYEIKAKNLEEANEKIKSEFKLNFEILETNSHEKIEELLKKTRLEIEENNTRNEKTINDMKKYFEAEKISCEIKLAEEKDKFLKKFQSQENLYTESFKELETEKNKKIDEITEEYDTLQLNFNNYINQSNMDLNLCNQQIESLNKFLHEQKESLENIQSSHKQNLQYQIESYNTDRISLENKADNLLNELNKKDKENTVLLVKKEHLENDIIKSQKIIENIKLEFENEKILYEEKISLLQNKFQDLYDELLLKKGEFSTELALGKQEIDFQNKKICELVKNIDEINLKYSEQIKTIKENLDLEYMEKIENLSKDKEDIENKLNLKKKEFKELEFEYSKDKSLLEKEKAVLNEKLLNVSKQKDELMESIDKEREIYNTQILEIKENNKNQNLIQIKENEFLKNRINKIEADNNELISNYDKDSNLWASKHQFLEEKLNKTRYDLTEYIKKYEISIENMKNQGLMEKDKFEDWKNLIVSKLEERYSTELKEYKENINKNYDEILNKKKELELDVKVLQDRLLNEQKAKMIDQGELGKKLAATIENEGRLRKQIDELVEDRDKKLKDMFLVSEKEREMHKNKIVELENKCREYENKRTNMAVDNIKDKVVFDKDKDLMQTEIEKLKEKIFNFERNYLKINSDNKDLIRENERLKKENRQFKSTSMLHTPKYARYNTNMIGKENRNNSNSSFDRNEGLDLINNLSTNVNKKKMSIGIESQRSDDEQMNNYQDI